MSSDAPTSTPEVGMDVHVLVVEDEAELARLMELELAHAGFTVARTPSGREALTLAAERSFDCVLLDIMLPDLGGMEVCRRLREVSDVAVVMVTARGQIPDKVRALDLGADDYVVKPVDFEELAARIRAVVRRRKGYGSSGRVLTVGDVVVYRDQHRVEVRGQAVELTPREYQLLEHLMLHRDWVQARETLLDRVWGFAYQGQTNMVDVARSEAAKRLGVGCATVVRFLREEGQTSSDGQALHADHCEATECTVVGVQQRAHAGPTSLAGAAGGCQGRNPFPSPGTRAIECGADPPFG